MQMKKVAGRKIRIKVFGGVDADGNPFVDVALVPGQKLGQSCHAISEVLNPGAAMAKSSWEDTPDPEKHEFVQRNVTQRI